MRNFRLLGLALLMLAACGRALNTPESLPTRVFPANEKFTMTLVMKSCSDVCLTYDQANCNVSIDGHVIKLDIDVPIHDANLQMQPPGGCGLACGPEVFAHCTIPSLAPGGYIVSSNGFTAMVTLTSSTAG
jgi:hypothetical protein